MPALTNLNQNVDMVNIGPAGSINPCDIQNPWKTGTEPTSADETEDANIISRGGDVSKM